MNNIDNATVNQETWNRIVIFYERFLSMEYWQYLTPLYCLVKQVASSEKAKSFRAGQSLVTLMISTTSYHGLEDNDPFVTVELQRTEKDEAALFEVEYWQGNTFIEKRVCDEENVLSVLDEFLSRLWRDTKSDWTY
jgi:hypothetical protein